MKNDCEACDKLANDLHWVLYREQKVNKTVVDRILRSVCMEVGFRHAKPMEIEAFCHEHVEEHWDDLIKALVKIYNDSGEPDKVRGIKRRFCGLMTEACETERKEMEAELEEKKRKEKEARLAARQNKQRGAPAKKKEEL